jgi:hypothetical protein
MKNIVLNAHEKEIGQMNCQKFISTIFSNNLDNIELNKERNILTSDYSITWLSLETIDYR